MCKRCRVCGETTMTKSIVSCFENNKNLTGTIIARLHSFPRRTSSLIPVNQFYLFLITLAVTFHSYIETLWMWFETEREVFSSKWRKCSKDKTFSSLQKQQESYQMAVDTTAGHFEEHEWIRSCKICLNDTLLTFFERFYTMKGDLLKQSYFTSSVSLEITLCTAAVIDLFTLLLDLELDAYRFKIQGKKHSILSRSFQSCSVKMQSVTWCNGYIEILAALLVVSLRLSGKLFINNNVVIKTYKHKWAPFQPNLNQIL